MAGPPKGVGAGLDAAGAPKGEGFEAKKED